MRITTTLLAACLCATLVNSLPLSGQGLRSQALDRLMVVEANNDSAHRNKRTIGILRQLFPEVSKSVNPEAVENQVVSEADSQPSQSQPQPQQQVIREQRSPAAAESQQNEVKVSFADEVAPSAGEGDLTPLEDIEASDDDSRNKRFLNFGGTGGGSGGGSGNFLFDIIRLVTSSGSGSSSGGGDAATNGEARAPEPGPQQEAVPGPVTRLFVIANRGISNLIQDLILRLAATSERIVNFKARLITSII